MLSRLFGHNHDTKPDFPTSADLPGLTPHEALAALGLLRLLIDARAAEVYTAAGSYDPITGRYKWNVWLEHHVVPGGKRIPLRDWAASVVCRDLDPDDGPETAA
jgi:hypothetical protein